MNSLVARAFGASKNGASLASGLRSMHGSAKSMSTHHPNHPDFLHAPYLYNLRFKRMSKLRSGLLVWGGFFGGTGLCFTAVELQQRKAGIK